MLEFAKDQDKSRRRGKPAARPENGHASVLPSPGSADPSHRSRRILILPAQRWFRRPNIGSLWPVPAVTALIAYGIWREIAGDHHARPFCRSRCFSWRMSALATPMSGLRCVSRHPAPSHFSRSRARMAHTMGVANGSGRSALPNRPNGANLNVSRPFVSTTWSVCTGKLE